MPASHQTIAEKQQALQAQLEPLRDSQARLAWLVEQSRQKPAAHPGLHQPENLVAGCLSKLWFVPELRHGRCYFHSDSDSQVVKAVAGLLCDFYSDLTPVEILAHDPKFLGNLGITQHLTPNRRNGLGQVWKKIRAFAEANADKSP